MPARSIAQQRFMGMVHAEKEGKLDKSKLDPEFAAKIERVAASIKAKAARDLAETKHKKLPKKVKKKSPPEGDSRGQNKKAEYIMNKLAAKKYPIPLEGTPSPHLLAKPLIKKIPIFGEGWAKKIKPTPGVGAAIERVLPFGKSGRHFEAPPDEVIKKTPGTKGKFQRFFPGGKSGFEYHEKKAAVNKQLAKLTQETFKYYKFVKKESTKMARIKAANARDNSSWPKYVLDKMEKVHKAKVKKKVQPKQLELFKGAAKKKSKKKKYKKRRSRPVKDTLAVGLGGAASHYIPGVPLQAGIAAKKSPRGKKARVAQATFVGGLLGATPATVKLLAHALTKKGPARKFKLLMTRPNIKNLQNFKGALKKMKKPFWDYMHKGAIGQGVGSMLGYQYGLRNKRPGPK